MLSIGPAPRRTDGRIGAEIRERWAPRRILGIRSLIGDFLVRVWWIKNKQISELFEENICDFEDVPSMNWKAIS